MSRRVSATKLQRQENAAWRVSCDMEGMRRVAPTRSSATAEAKPYDDLRRARHGELRHHDEAGLRGLLEDYFADADDLERFSKPPRAA